MKRTRFESGGATLPLPTPYHPAGPLTITLRACLGLAVLAGLGVGCEVWPWWMLIVAVGLPWLLLTGGDLVSLGRHVVAGLEPIMRVDLNGDGQIGPSRDTIRLVPYRNGPATPILELPDGTETTDADLSWVVDHLPDSGRVPGWSAWQGETLPSGATLTDYSQLKPFMDTVAGLGGIEGRGPKAAGRMALTRSEIKARLEL